MPYTWSETITKNVTTVKASHVTELHSNIDTERIRRGLGAASYTQTPLQHTNKTLNVDISEMRTALDATKDADYCHTHYLTHNGNDLSAHKSANYGSNYPSYDGTHYPTNDATNNASYDATHWPGHYGAYYPGYDGTHWPTYHLSYLTTYNPSK